MAELAKMETRTVRCRSCGAVLVELLFVEVPAAEKAVVEVTMKCRNKHCVSRKDPCCFDIEMIPPKVNFKEKKRT